ncbi:uncharacterized protein F4812DRAFT_468319 [Daldinia caldariorum]|uniref:uncharacterized protein n=1 Tax=Daldinia caldariorum TaxID=326644 RepID=UPI002008BD4B|nr:uncharacterized protein F4812DRAFT_468319 [Daldinia caldariorum]KAI1463884.1 hypothetical protein F4812DRAFT_468319 [Daldinia caldariorum]
MTLRIPELPYYAPEEELPFELPGPDVLAQQPEFQNHLQAHRGIRINDHYVVKFGLDEAINTLIVGKYTNIRIPKLYAAYPYHHEGDKVWVLVTEPVGDLAVDEDWFRNTEHRDSALMHSVKRQLQEARLQLGAVPHPGTGFNLYGHLRAFKNPFLDLKLFSTAEQARDWQFGTMAPKYRVEGDGDAVEHYAKRWEAAHSRFCTGLASGDEAIFTHFNLSPSTVKVRADGRIVVTGWEHAGFFPPEFEYVTAYRAGELGSGWTNDVAVCLSGQGAYREALELVEKTAQDYEEAMRSPWTSSGPLGR